MEDEELAKRPSDMAGPPPAAPTNIGPLNYRHTRTVEPTARGAFAPGVQVAIGFVGGIALSSIAWFTGEHPGVHTDSMMWIYVVLAIKIIGGITLVCFRQTRPAGSGLLTSLGVGCLIFGAGFVANCKPI
jgi:hypothetical protein